MREIIYFLNDNFFLKNLNLFNNKIILFFLIFHNIF
jgi:hypothetical protein